MSLDREIALLTSSDKRSNALLALPVLRRLAISLLSTVTVVAAAHTAAADAPRSPAPGDTAPVPPTTVIVTPPPPSDQPTNPDDAHIQELVDREVARILAERAAADVAQKEADDKARAQLGTAGRISAPTDQPGTPGLNGDYAKGGSGFMDGRLNFTLTNENVFAKPGDSIPSVPGWRFGTPNSLGVLFFDNYDTRYSGYEDLSFATMYHNYRQGHLEVEGGIVLLLNDLTGNAGGVNVSDAGSYILTSWWKDPNHIDPTRVTMTAFPVSSDRFRLGFSYRLSWGGNEEYRRTAAAVPGVKFQLDTEKGYAFVGFKSSVVLDPSTAEQVGVFAALAGAGYDLNDMFRLEFNGGYFNRGDNELIDVQTQPVDLFGASVQLSAHHGMPVGSSIDYKLYRYDPERIGRVYQKAQWNPGLSWIAQTEATILGQTLKDPNNTGATKIQWGTAADVNVRIAKDHTRFKGDISYRDLAFILHSVPSLPTYSDFPSSYVLTGDIFADIGVDHNWLGWITAGLTAGIEKPASLTSPTGGIPGDTTTAGTAGTSTAVIRYNNIGSQTSAIISVLPAGKTVEPQLAVKATGRFDIGAAWGLILDAYYSYDPNQTELVRGSSTGLFRYEFGQLNQLGFNITVQAKF